MKLFRSYIVLAMALLITLSASGISVSLHKCCGSIQGFSLFGNPKECKMAKRQTQKDCPENSKTTIHKKSCCTDQKISLTQSADKTSPVTTKNQVKETKQNFDVLFFYTLITNWFSSSDQEEEIQKPSPGLFIIEALILLLQQFRI